MAAVEPLLPSTLTLFVARAAPRSSRGRGEVELACETRRAGRETDDTDNDENKLKHTRDAKKRDLKKITVSRVRETLAVSLQKLSWRP